MNCATVILLDFVFVSTKTLCQTVIISTGKYWNAVLISLKEVHSFCTSKVTFTKVSRLPIR